MAETPRNKLVKAYLPAELHARLTEHAQHNRRKVSSDVAYLIEQALAAEEGPQTPGTSPVHYR